MTQCPVGHDSAATDFCDVCGRPVGAWAVPPPPAGEPAVPDLASAEICPVCQHGRTGQFCEQCGHDFDGPAGLRTPAAATWFALVRADREYFDSVTEADGTDPLQFPADWPEHEVLLTGAQVQIGRHSPARGIEPDIDLSGPPPDVGASREHAALLAEPDDSWVLVDQGSAGGTLLNGVAVAPHVRTPLHDRDEISIGRWTVLTIRVQPAGMAGRPHE